MPPAKEEIGLLLVGTKLGLSAESDFRPTSRSYEELGLGPPVEEGLGLPAKKELGLLVRFDPGWERSLRRSDFRKRRLVFLGFGTVGRSSYLKTEKPLMTDPYL